MVTSGGETQISVTVNGEVLPSGENDLLVKKTDTPIQMNGIALKDTTMPRSISEQQMPPRPPSAAMNGNGESKDCCANGGGGLVAGAAAIFASIKHQHYQLFGHRSPPLLGSKKRRCGPRLNTQERLFGITSSTPATPTKSIAKQQNPTFKSQIFGGEPASPAKTPKKCIPIVERNPITGEVKLPK